MRIREIKQLFNSLDATPFPSTDLDADAEKFFLDWAMEFRSDARLLIRIHAEQLPEDTHATQQVETALHSFLHIARTLCGGGSDGSCHEDV